MQLVIMAFAASLFLFSFIFLLKFFAFIFVIFSILLVIGYIWFNFKVKQFKNTQANSQRSQQQQPHQHSGRTFDHDEFK